MKCSDVITQLIDWLPRYSPLFSDALTIANVERLSDLLVRITTTIPHGFITGEPVVMTGIPASFEITNAVVDGFDVICTTDVDHDLTLNEATDIPTYIKILVDGSLGTYELLDVPNRYTFVIKIGSNPLVITGSFLQTTYSFGYNITSLITVDSTTSFTYEMNFPVGGDVNYFVNARANKKLRISGAVDLQTVLNSYTKQEINKVWAFVILGENQTHIKPQSRNGDYMQIVNNNFSVYIIVPNKGTELTDTNGRFARDLIEEIRNPLFKSLLAHTFPTWLASPTESVCAYAGDGYSAYNGAYYVHEFKFQQQSQITVGDTNYSITDRAFRDIGLTFVNENSITPYFASIDLDDEPVEGDNDFGNNFGVF